VNQSFGSRRIVITLAIVLVGVLLCGTLFTLESREERAGALLRQAEILVAHGELAEAERLARQAIELEASADWAFEVAAQCALERNAFEQALSDLSRISRENEKRWLNARRTSAELLHNEVFRFREAERAYLDVLSLAPDDVAANDGYARLLGLCGRRTEAIPHVLRLIRAGEFSDLLILLSRESGSLSNASMLEAARQADPTDPGPLLGQAKAADSMQEAPLALKKLQEASRLSGLPAGFHGQLGRQLLANNRFKELQTWASEVSTEHASAEAWQVLGELSARAGERESAIRCFWEAVRKRPEVVSALNQLALELSASGRQDLAAPLQLRVEQLNELNDVQQQTIMSETTPGVSEMRKLVNAYEAVGRLWEAYAWARLTLAAGSVDRGLQQIIERLEPQLRTLPLQLTAPDFNPARKMALASYSVSTSEELFQESGSGGTSTGIAFRQSRDETGFDFQYFTGGKVKSQRMFEFAGGGIAAIDYDRDGNPDLFCTQGRLWKESNDRQHSDRLFRNRDGEHFQETAISAGVIGEDGFGQGVSAGDANNDGFPDLYVANTGTNCLWLNCGDGTFNSSSAFLAELPPSWTTSCLIADVNGDSHPDLYDVNYLGGDDVFERVCAIDDGSPNMCTPYDFPPAVDCVWLGDGRGGFRNGTVDVLQPSPAGKGLGIATADFGNGRLSLFVANDTVANFLYSEAAPGDGKLTDLAATAGLAFNRDGKAEACMGIAVADCTQDGRLDLLVTNFLHESNTLYALNDGFLFDDLTRETGLHETTLPVLGFGTQFLDANLDGRQELFIANGFTHDLSRRGTPYAMKPQLFEWVGDRLELLPARQVGAWCDAERVGRAVARLDWNRDGRPDLAVGLLDNPSYLLTNTSDPGECRFLTLRLTATSTARDAIGAVVTAVIGGKTHIHQLTAGDGYQCTNERRLMMGVGATRRVDSLRIAWPSGRQQEFRDVHVSQHYLLVEGGELLPAPQAAF